MRMSAEQMADLARAAGAAAVNAQAEVAQTATRALTPVETHGLVESIKVRRGTSRSLIARVVSDSPYAIYQHENLSLHHESGRAKFMEAGVASSTSAISAAGAAAARRILG